MTREMKVAVWVVLWSLLIGVALTVALASERDPRCLQLEQLSEQYRGVALTAAQKVFKVKATAWHSFNCRGGRRSAENR